MKSENYHIKIPYIIFFFIDGKMEVYNCSLLFSILHYMHNNYNYLFLKSIFNTSLNFIFNFMLNLETYFNLFPKLFFIIDFHSFLNFIAFFLFNPLLNII